MTSTFRFTDSKINVVKRKLVFKYKYIKTIKKFHRIKSEFSRIIKGTIYGLFKSIYNKITEFRPFKTDRYSF